MGSQPEQQARAAAEQQARAAAERARDLARSAAQERSATAENAPPPADAAAARPPARSWRQWLQMGAVALGVVAGTLLPGGVSEAPGDPGQATSAAMIAATLAFQAAPTIEMPSAGGPWSTCTATASTSAIGDLDLVLAIDTTASMGRVIGDVKANAQALIANLKQRGGSTRVGLVAYRDRGDSYVVQSVPLTGLDDAGAERLVNFISSLKADGGGDWPEAVDDALAAAVGMAWRPNATASIVVIGDAPAHPDRAGRAFDLATSFAAHPGAQVSVIDAGSGAAPFMRQLPDVANGQYVTYDGNILSSLFPAITGCPSR